MRDKEKCALDREAKAMILGVLKKGYFEIADFEVLARKYDYKPDEIELTGSIPISDWILWRIEENAKIKSKD